MYRKYAMVHTYVRRQHRWEQQHFTAEFVACCYSEIRKCRAKPYRGIETLAIHFTNFFLESFADLTSLTELHTNIPHLCNYICHELTKLTSGYLAAEKHILTLYTTKEDIVNLLSDLFI